MPNLKKFLTHRNLKHIGDLGSGATGKVYLCATSTGEKRAVKEVKYNTDKNKALYHREVKLMESIGIHPYIMHLYYSAIIGQTGFLELEYVEGVTLDKLINIYKKTNSLFFIKFAKTLFQGIQYLHGLGIYHRDLNSQNVLVCIDSSDADMPFKAKIIDLGIGCLVDSDVASCPNDYGDGGVAGTSRFSWPYESSEKHPAVKTLECKDIWLAGSLLYQIAYGVDFRFFDEDAREGYQALWFYTDIMSAKGGYPAPPDLSLREREYLEPEPELADDMLPEQLRVVQMYKSYVIGKDRDPIYDFNPEYTSIIHDLIRLTLARNVESCFSATDILRYIKEQWDKVIIFGIYPQRKKLNNCDIPCEDPLNNYYEHNCNKCDHCQWNAEGIKRKQHTVHCSSITPNQRTQEAKDKCLSMKPTREEAYIWNPYRKTCETIREEDDAYLSDRYSILYTDGGDVPLPGDVIRHRIMKGDHTLVESDKVILKRLKSYQYHPLMAISTNFFYNFVNNKNATNNYNRFTNMSGIDELSQLTDLRLDANMDKKYGKGNYRKSGKTGK